MTVNYTGGLNFTGPSKGETNWDVTLDAAFTRISAHGHAGGADGKQIATAAIATNAVTDAKIRLANNAALRSRNAANSADLDLLKANTSNKAALPTTTLFADTEQTPTSGTSVDISSNRMQLSAGGASTLTINVPGAAHNGQPVFVYNSGAGTWTVTITGQDAAYDVATILTKGSMILFPIGTTTWAAIPGGGCTLA